MAKKFVFITREQYEEIGKLFANRDPNERLTLRTFGDFSDIASYSPKYDTVVFNTIHNGNEDDDEDRFSRFVRTRPPF